MEFSIVCHTVCIFMKLTNFLQAKFRYDLSDPDHRFSNSEIVDAGARITHVSRGMLAVRVLHQKHAVSTSKCVTVTKVTIVLTDDAQYVNLIHCKPN